MTHDDYPDEVEIVETNFKTDQQADAAETIAEEWPVDLDRLAEEGQHVKMFYKQVLEQFLGPAEAEVTFADIKDEYGSLEQWADDEPDTDDEVDDVEVPDVDDIEPGVGESTSESSAGTVAESDGSGPVSAGSDSAAGGGDSPSVPDGIDASVGDVPDDVDAQRRAWFRAGFREGVEFALENPELFDN